MNHSEEVFGQASTIDPQKPELQPKSDPPVEIRQVLDKQRYEDQLILKDRALAATAEGITISDPSLPDNPLIYANAGFERLTGYSADEVIGRNCRFLQGPGTDPRTVDEIRRAIQGGRGITIQILNYRKDGTPFWNRLSITPVRGASGPVTHYIGVQSDITDQKNAEDALLATKEELQVANQRMKGDLEAAARIQQSLLPEAMPDVPGVSFCWAFRPSSELAGDILNVFRLDTRHIGMYVLDVSGHGVAAALMSVTVSRLMSPFPGRSCLFTSQPDSPGQYELASPVEVARKLNEYFPFDPRTGQYFTILYGLLDTEANEFRYVSAGHLPPVRLPSNGEATTIMKSSGPPIGLLPTPEYEEHRIELKTGDRVLLCTDGVLEAENASEQAFGMDGLLDCLCSDRQASLSEALDSIVAGLEDWRGSQQLEDDASILAFEIQPAFRPAP